MRQDFLQLTPESLAALANWGLVKRAQRELSASRPELSLQEGTLRAVFADGVVCTFPAGRPAGEGVCSCATIGWCRHRVGALLAYAEAAEGAAEADFRVDLAEVQRQLGKRLWSKALAAKARGMVVEVFGPPWQVRLPGCTVRFLVGGEAGYCRCDCELEGPCEHQALAAWAIQERQGQAGPLVWASAAPVSSFVHSQAWLGELIQAGCAQSEALWRVWGQRVSAEMAGQSWLRVLLEELRELGLAYQSASTTYTRERWLFCMLSLALRLRDRSSHLLGGEVAWEQELEHSRLSCLGCRVRGTGQELYWADAAGQVLVQRMARQPLVPSLGPLAQVAVSQVVSRGVVRRADGSLRFRRDRQRHSLAPLGLDWRCLPESLIWPGREAWVARLQTRPTRLLEPPTLAQNFWLVPLDWTEAGVYDPGRQMLSALAGDSQGGTLKLRRVYQSECPQALDALAHHLGQSVWVSGVVSLEGGEIVLEPVALGTAEQMVVLDLTEGLPPFDWPLALAEPDLDPLNGLLQEALGLCQQAAHLGLAQLLPSFHQRRLELAERLQQAPLLNLSQALSHDWRQESFWGVALRAFLAAERM